ncbi:hypothetical protein SCATT_p06460 (plasmid) [Streptantibioticus cattleyicolor NRRL 8057 = DSM 46488]|uniref:Uncharacterized protein n=1 Tax=Streptantibioticus cattleyicolor (strain ATCC 35852 / DSM 46488 / JCM 4925 / NBRC 14057 / NRRL 8057) TaxID=1003195 RepID=G8XH93_STREN|nr:hypothetical protein SCATT_p06460 [Streptantibioticus cattleyicolor NRRL 8057 = DSM 46488]
MTGCGGRRGLLRTVRPYGAKAAASEQFEQRVGELRGGGGAAKGHGRARACPGTPLPRRSAPAPSKPIAMIHTGRCRRVVRPPWHATGAPPPGGRRPSGGTT